MVLFKAGAYLTVALTLAPGDGFAQSPPQPAEAHTSPQAASAAKPLGQQTQAQAPAATKPHSESARRQRPTKRSARISSRQSSPNSRQSLEQARTSRGGPTLQGLTLTANTVGGYDDDVTGALGAGARTLPTKMASGYSGDLDATLVYRRRTALSSLVLSPTGTLRMKPGYLQHQAAGGMLDVDARTRVGQDLTLGVAEVLTYEPFFSVFSGAATDAPSPPGTVDMVPVTSLFARRSLNSGTNLEIDRRWSGRDSTLLSYTFRLTRATSEEASDSITHDVRTVYRRTLAGGFKVRADYRYINRDSIASGGTLLFTREHNTAGGADIDKALSRHRYLTLSFDAGARYLESAGGRARHSYHTWVPTGSATATVGLSPRWSVEGGWRRASSLLRGVTDEVYTTDLAYLTTRGLVARRINLGLGGTYSNSKTPRASGADERFKVYGTSLQVAVALTTRLTATAGYYYYYHHYSTPSSLAAGFPATYGRNAVRVWLTIRAPLLGTEHGWGGLSSPRR